MPKKLTKEFVIEKMNFIHNNKYQYVFEIYKGIKDKIKIKCPKHDIFEQTIDKHLQGQGCKKCGIESNILKSKTSLKDFIEKAQKVHKINLYDYSLSNYINNRTKIQIKCNECGYIFEQIPTHHLNGCGCPKCSYKKRTLTTENFVVKANLIHSNQYKYIDEYTHTKTKINILCKRCNKFFLQRPNDHLSGYGCPYCVSIVSKPEISWLNFLNINQKYRQQKIKINKKCFKVDAYVPEINTIYEFLGDYWHGNPKIYNLNDIHPKRKCTFLVLYQKTIERIKLPEENGYKVVYIWESDWKLIQS